MDVCLCVGLHVISSLAESMLHVTMSRKSVLLFSPLCIVLGKRSDYQKDLGSFWVNIAELKYRMVISLL